MQTVARIINPEDCKVMVSFNDATFGQDAEDLANFLTANGHPTFCTRIYCPPNPGSWRKSTKAEETIVSAQILRRTRLSLSEGRMLQYDTVVEVIN